MKIRSDTAIHIQNFNAVGTDTGILILLEDKSMQVVQHIKKVTNMLIGKDVVIGELVLNRTLKQNAYLHVLLSEICRHSGYTMQKNPNESEMKECKFDILSVAVNEGAWDTYKIKAQEVMLGNMKVPAPTSEASKDQLVVLIDWLIDYMQNQLSMNVPSINEYFGGYV